jgi:DNA polymerase III subunit beta
MEKKFTVDQKPLNAILASMQPICSKRTPLEATTSILFQVGHKELVLKSTDLEISLQASCTLNESDADVVYSFLVSGKRIFEVVKELEGAVTCTLNHHQITLQASDVTLSLNIKDAQEFPPFPERIENLMSLNAQLFHNMLESVGFLIPQNNANPALNGLLLELTPQSLSMTTTDGHCLAQVITTKTSFNEPKTWLLPRRAIFELKKILETVPDTTLFLGMCGNQLVFSGDLFNFFTKVLAEKFPSYSSIIDRTSFIPASIDRTRLIKTLRRSACLLSNEFIATKFTFDDAQLHVSITNKEVGALDEQLPFNSSAKTHINLRMYAPYLLNGIQALDGNELTFYLKGSTSPLIFQSEGEEYSMTYLVMPIAPSKAYPST